MDLLGAIVSFLFDSLAAAASVIIAPIDLMINGLVPQATSAINNFFSWVISLINQFMDFINWFFYVLGIKPETWQLIMTVCSALLLVWIFLFPVKMVMSVFRGMKD